MENQTNNRLLNNAIEMLEEMKEDLQRDIDNSFFFDDDNGDETYYLDKVNVILDALKQIS